MTSRNFGYFLTHLPHRHEFYYQGLWTVVKESLTPSPLRPWRHLWTTPNKGDVLQYLCTFDRSKRISDNQRNRTAKPRHLRPSSRWCTTSEMLKSSSCRIDHGRILVTIRRSSDLGGKSFLSLDPVEEELDLSSAIRNNWTRLSEVQIHVIFNKLNHFIGRGNNYFSYTILLSLM